MSLPGGIRIRIVLVLVGIVAGALGTAYMIVVPSLERRLVDARLEQLSSLGVPLARKLPEDTLLWQDRVESYQVETNARVVAFGVLSKNRQALSVVADSRTKSSRDVQNDPVALAALASGDLEQKWVVVAGEDYAEVAVPAEARDRRALPGRARGLARHRADRPRAPPAGDGVCARARPDPRPDGCRNALASPASTRVRGGADCRRRLRRADRRSRQRRDRRARSRVRPHARSARAARQRAQGVRRERLP